jgi:hypothetical protein
MQLIQRGPSLLEFVEQSNFEWLRNEGNFHWNEKKAGSPS